MTLPAAVASLPRTACVEPYADVRGCVDETVTAEGMAWALPVWECIINLESGFNRWAVGGAGERGLAQVHPVWFGTFDAGRLFEPDYNVKAAIYIYRAQGWSAWSVHARCGV